MYPVKKVTYNGFGAQTLGGYENWQARFVGHTPDPGTAIYECTDGRSRLLPTFVTKEALSPAPATGVLFGLPSGVDMNYSDEWLVQVWAPYVQNKPADLGAAEEIAHCLQPRNVVEGVVSTIESIELCDIQVPGGSIRCACVVKNTAYNRNPLANHSHTIILPLYAMENESALRWYGLEHGKQCPTSEMENDMKAWQYIGMFVALAILSKAVQSMLVEAGAPEEIGIPLGIGMGVVFFALTWRKKPE